MAKIASAHSDMTVEEGKYAQITHVGEHQTTGTGAISIQKMKRARLIGGLNEDFIKQVTPDLHLPKCPSADIEGIFQAVRMPRKWHYQETCHQHYQLVNR